MQSLSKIQIDNDIIQQVISLHFGSQARLADAAELTDGWFNTAYRFTLADGLKGVLKAAPPPGFRALRYETNIIQAEVDAMRLVRQHTGVPVPEIYAFDRSHSLVQSDYFLMSFLEGIPLDKVKKNLTPEESQSVERQAGEFTRQFNAIHGDGFGLLGQAQRFATWRQAMNRLICDLLQDGQDLAVELPLPYAELYARLQILYPSLDAVDCACLVHWDLWDGNIFVDPQSKQITGLIDFERALWGDPLMEIYFGEFTDPRSYIEGYGVNLFGAPGAHQRRQLYNLYLQLVMVIESYYREYSPEHRQWTAARLVKGLQTL